jgi:hypothetical protein
LKQKHTSKIDGKYRILEYLEKGRVDILAKLGILEIIALNIKREYLTPMQGLYND